MLFCPTANVLLCFDLQSGQKYSAFSKSYKNNAQSVNSIHGSIAYILKIVTLMSIPNKKWTNNFQVAACPIAFYMNPNLALITTHLPKNALQVRAYNYQGKIIYKITKSHILLGLPSFHHLCGAKISCICHSIVLTAIAAGTVVFTHVRNNIEQNKLIEQIKHLVQSQARYIPFHNACKVTALPLASFSLKSWMEDDYHSYHNKLMIFEQPATQ